jgi:aryl-alcohol dehydrogenase-like predicted oxidoreductase
MPRFQQDNLQRNLTLVNALRRIGQEKGATPAQMAITWIRSRGSDIVPIVGARRLDQLEGTLAALNLNLDADDLARIGAAVEPGLTAGARYDRTQMQHLDREGSA